MSDAETPPRAEPNAAALDLPKTLTVEFGGKQWPVPKLAFKQIRLIHKKMDRLSDLLVVKQVPMGEYTDDDLEDLAFILWVALTRAHPTLSRAEFDEMPTDRLELSRAFFGVLIQANGSRKETIKSGEDQGAASP